MTGGPTPPPSLRLAALESLPLTAAEWAAVLDQFAQLGQAVETLEVFVSAADEPATGFDPLLGEDA